MTMKSKEQKYIGYVRVGPTEEKGILCPLSQELAITRYIDDPSTVDMYTFYDKLPDVSFSNRKGWKNLEQHAHKGNTIVIKDITRFTCNIEQGTKKYMELYDKGINLVFVENPSINTTFIAKMKSMGKKNHITIETPMEDIVKILFIGELEKLRQEKLMTSNIIKKGIKASNKKQGRKPGKLDKLTDELKNDIKEYLNNNKTYKQVDLMKKHEISRNTLKKYIEIVKNQL